MIDSTRLTDPYIYVRDNVLPEDKCKKIIRKFNANKKAHRQGTTGAGVNKSIKDSLDLMISDLSNWKKEDKLFSDIVKKGHENYFAHLNSPDINSFTLFTNPSMRYVFNPLYKPDLEIIDTGYQIQKTKAGKGYIWHNDFNQYGQIGSPEIRYLTFILYLNSVEEGWTQFYNGDQVSPQAGRLVFFPATWTYVHQGYPPKQTKYLMTGWMHTKRKSPEQNGEN